MPIEKRQKIVYKDFESKKLIIMEYMYFILTTFAS